MEARGGFVLDKARYKALFAEMCRREEAACRAGGGGRSGGADGGGGNGGDTDDAPPNENLERFKWWLGMPSSYYRSKMD